jgi:replicative DNA helicase
MSDEIKLNISDRNMDLALLKGLSTYPEYVTKVIGRLKEEHFADKNTKFLFKILNDIYSKNHASLVTTEQIRKSTLPESNPGLAAVLVEVDKFPSYDKDFLVEQTDNFIKMRSMQTAVIKSYDLIQDIDSYGKIEQYVKEALVSGMAGDLGLDYFGQIAERYARKKEALVGNISSGFPDIDNLLLETGHAFAPGTLNMFNGESNMGKSIWLGQVAINALGQSKNTVIISLEMSQDLYASRIDANIAKTPSDNLVSQENVVEARLTEFQKLHGGAKLFIKQMPTGTASALDIYRYLYDLKINGFEPDVVIIDYLNLMKPTSVNQGDGTYTRVKYIAEEVRALAVELQVVVWTATQLNRSGYSAVPDASHTSESMGTVHTADFMMGIYQEDQDKDQGIMKGVIIKNRYGPNNVFLRFHIYYMHLTISPGNSTGFQPSERDREIANNISQDIPPGIEDNDQSEADITAFLNS